MSRMKIKRKKKEPEKKFPFLILVIVGGVVLVGASVLFFTRDRVDPNFIPEVTGAPRLQMDKEKIDVGDVPTEKIVTASFIMTNVGDQMLYITRDPYVEVIEGC